MKQIPLQLLVIEAIHQSETAVLSPLSFPAVVHLNTTPQHLADRMSNALQGQLLGEGVYYSLLSHIAPERIEKEQLTVSVKPSKKNKYPALDLNFDLFYVQHKPDQFVGFIPILNIEAAAESLEKLRHTSRENILLEFVRNKRLQSVRELITTQWFSSVKAHTLPTEFFFYSFSELEALRKDKEENLLPKIAHQLDIASPQLFGLAKEFKQLLTAMKGKHRNSLMITGGAGRGKTALIQEFCFQKRKHGLGKVNIWEVSASQLLHRLITYGSWEEYLADVCNELRKSRDILYITNFAELFEVGQYVGNNMSIGDYLRDYVARGEITLLSEITPEEATQIEQRAPGYLALFTQVKIGDITPFEIRNIVVKKATQLAKSKQITLEKAAIEETLRLQQWYTPYSGLPGKTIYFLAAIIAAKEQSEDKRIDIATIYTHFCQETGVPEFMLNPSVALNYVEMELFFKNNIYGQAQAVHTILDLLVAIKAAVIKRGKPLASLLFVGPTGVGKTEMAKTLAQFLFGNRERLTRFDMSEYADQHSVMRLTGDLTKSDGLLTAAVRKHPFSVVLFDELEKVHPSFYDLLLQILGEGRLTDARGRVADFCSTIIIMTSNIGATNYQTSAIGFGDRSDQKAHAITHFQRAVQAHFRPELFNRLDRIIPFVPLEKAIIRQIVDREIRLVLEREGIKGRNLVLEIAKGVLDYLGEKGYNLNYGARFLQRCIHEQFIVPFSKQLNRYKAQQSLKVQLNMKAKKIMPDIQQVDDLGILQQKVDETGNLSLIGFAEKVSQSRRQTAFIERGTVYTSLLAEFHRMEQLLRKMKKQKKEHIFWQNKANQTNYYAYQNTIHAFEKHSDSIEKIELNNLLLLNNIEQESELKTLYNTYQVWLKGIHHFKIELVTLTHPEYKYCTIGIYGGGGYLSKTIELYKTLSHRQKYACIQQAIWLNTDIRFEQYNFKKEHLLPETERLYLKKPFYEQADEIYFSPESKKPPANYRLVGVEFEVKGELPYLYFRDEGGYHEWLSSSHKKHPYFVQVSAATLDKFKTPVGVHRKQFFKEISSRRKYGTNEVVDKMYSIKEAPQHFSAILAQTLEEQFLIELDNLVVV